MVQITYLISLPILISALNFVDPIAGRGRFRKKGSPSHWTMPHGRGSSAIDIARIKPWLRKQESRTLFGTFVSPVKAATLGHKNHAEQIASKESEDIERWADMSQEARIKRHILFHNEHYDKSSRPVKDDTSNITVQIGISLYHIAAMKWNDAFLRWDREKFGNVDHVLIPSDTIWKPDIRIANAVDYEAETIETNVIVSADGNVLWMSPHSAKVYCTLDMRNFPFDVQTCDIKFFSWTYNGFQVDLIAEATNPSYMSDNQEWTVRRITHRRNVVLYACCPEPFPVISFTVNMKRGPMFYIFNLIFPCVLIYGVALLGFFLPIQSIEKINLEVTVLLAQVVFLQVIGETMPANPENLPLLGWMYAATMLLVSIELVSAVGVTNMYYKGKEGEEVPYWLYRVLFWDRIRRELCKTCGRPKLRLYRHEEKEKAAELRLKNAFSNLFAGQTRRIAQGVKATGAAVMTVIPEQTSPSPHQCNGQDFGKPPKEEEEGEAKDGVNRRRSRKSTSMTNFLLSAQDASGLEDSHRPSMPDMNNDGQEESNSVNARFFQASRYRRLHHVASKPPPPAPSSSSSRPPLLKSKQINEVQRATSLCNTNKTTPRRVMDPRFGRQTTIESDNPSARRVHRRRADHPRDSKSNARMMETPPPVVKVLTNSPSGAVCITQNKEPPAPPPPVEENVTIGHPITHATQWVRTKEGCTHIIISWREAAERLDGYLFWVFVIVSLVVFISLFSSVATEK